jgi:RNA-directed DNA polymerase
MGLGGLFKKLLGGSAAATGKGAERKPRAGSPQYTVDELARRLGMSPAALRESRVEYRTFSIPKRAGGERWLAAPSHDLKALQRTILRRLLRRLKAHPAATGFERGQSIATNARSHAGAAVIVRLDIKSFFTSTLAERVKKFFLNIGWNEEAADLLVKLTTFKDALPQGAPTSPRLANLVNFRLDARLSGLAAKFGAVYTRYADDMTFSFKKDSGKAATVINPRNGKRVPGINNKSGGAARNLVACAKRIVNSEGYAIHGRKKLSIRRKHQRQVVTGLVVNDGARLPREVRRRLRAIGHRLRTGKEATITAQQLAGWKALESMIEKQSGR